MCQTHLRLQSYKKYFKYTIPLCKIYILNKYFTKKARRFPPLARTNLFLWLIQKSSAKIQKIIDIVSKMLIKIDTRKYILHLRYCSATITDNFSNSVILNNSFFS